MLAKRRRQNDPAFTIERQFMGHGHDGLHHRVIAAAQQDFLERAADIPPTRIEPPYKLLLGRSIERTGDDYYDVVFSALTEYYHYGRTFKRDGREWVLADE